MQLYFENPEAFGLLAVLAVFVWLNRGSLADHTRLQRALSCAVRCVAAALLVTALALPHLALPSRRLAFTVLVDVSASASQDAIRDARTFARRLDREKGDAELALVAFAGRPAAVGNGPEGAWPTMSEEDVRATDVAGAIDVALATVPQGCVGRVIVCSDGLATRGDAHQAAVEARRRGVRLMARPYPRADRDEVLLAEVALPEDVPPATSAKVNVTVTSSAATRAVLTLYRNKWKVLERTVELEEGENRFGFDVRAPASGFLDVSAQVEAVRDTYADNNAARAVAPVRAEPRVLYIAGREQDARFLARALDSKRIKVDVRTGEAFPTSLPELENYSLVILGDVGLADLPHGTLELLDRYVRDLGGGLLTLGGENAYGLGGYDDTLLERMLPVAMRSQTRRDVPSLALALVIDKSGSMANQKIELAKSAALATADLLTARDYIGVVTFDASAYALCPMTSAADRAAVADRVARLKAGGGTNIYPALVQAREELLSVPARLKHVILLSDGRSTGAGYDDMALRMSAEGITMSTVAVGDGADTDLLARLASLGRGRYYFTDDPGNIPRIFLKETMAAQKSAIVEEPFVPNVLSHAEVLRGVPFEEAPPLYGYVSLEPKPLGEVLLASDRGEPVLARRRYGLGKTAAFASDATNRWAADWIEWPGFATFFAQLARDTMRSNDAGNRFVPRLSIEGDRGTIVADLCTPSGRFVDDAELAAVVVSPSLEDRQVALTQIAPGRYSGAFDAAQRGAYLARCDARSPGASPVGGNCAASRGYPAEYARFGTDRSALADLAETSGGAIVETVADALAPDERTAHRDVDLTPVFLAAGMIVLLVDVLVRRLRFPETA